MNLVDPSNYNRKFLVYSFFFFNANNPVLFWHKFIFTLEWWQFFFHFVYQIRSRLMAKSHLIIGQKCEILDIGFCSRQILSNRWMCALSGKYVEKVELTRHGRNLVCDPAAAGLSWSKIFKQKKRQCDMSDTAEKNTKLSINWEFNQFSTQLYYNRSARDYHAISFTNTYFVH